MQITVELTGTAPLLMHNPQMVDPEFDINRQLKMLTSKRKRTDEDISAIKRLEWYGGLYTDQDGKIVTQPTAKPRKCFIETARINKMGKTVERALSFHDINVPLAYDGPDSIHQLWESGRFHSYLSVGVNGKRVMRMRPSFFPWALSLQGLLIEDAGLNFEDLERIVSLAGESTGIGDNRVNGYGRFSGKVRAA